MPKKTRRIQAPVRLYPDTYDKIKAKLTKDKLTFQKLSEILFAAYLRNNKEVMRLVQKHADEKYARKRKNAFDEMEAEEILRTIEKDYSPLRDFDKAIEELENE